MTPQYEKAFSKAKSFLETGSQITSWIDTAYPKKRIFPKYDRRPGKKKKKEMAKAFIQFSARMGIVQIMTILSQPIPKFPRGAAPSGIIDISSSDVVKLESGQMILTGLRSGKTCLQQTITNSHQPTPDKLQ